MPALVPEAPRRRWEPAQVLPEAARYPAKPVEQAERSLYRRAPQPRSWPTVGPLLQGREEAPGWQAPPPVHRSRRRSRSRSGLRIGLRIGLGLLRGLLTGPIVVLGLRALRWATGIVVDAGYRNRPAIWVYADGAAAIFDSVLSLRGGARQQERSNSETLLHGDLLSGESEPAKICVGSRNVTWITFKS